MPSAVEVRAGGDPSVGERLLGKESRFKGPGPMLQEDLGEGTLRPRAEHSGQRHHVRKCENYSETTDWAEFHRRGVC